MVYSVATLIVTAVVLPILGVAAVGLRYWVRLRLQPTFIGIDDYFIAIACLLACGMVSFELLFSKLTLLLSSMANISNSGGNADCWYEVL